jgi:hypothetical protein
MHMALSRPSPRFARTASIESPVFLEPLEGRTLLSASGTLMINGTAAKNDNIVLYNPAGSTHVDVSETIPATFKIKGGNSSGSTVTFEAVYTGNGRVTISPDTFHNVVSGACGGYTIITPTADSSSPNDVHIIMKVDGKQVAEDVMTVVSVDFQDKVYSPDTPQEMITAGAYRIMPRKDTPFEVHVTPDLAGSGGQSVTLRVNGQSSNNGAVKVDGGASYAIKSGTDIFVELNGGTTQTKASVPLAYASGKEGVLSNAGTIGATPNPNANNLQLAVEVRGRQTSVESDGFSVAAIPIRMSLGAAKKPAVGDVGFNVTMVVQSDSGNIKDLDQVGIGELVQNVNADTGGYGWIAGTNSNNQYSGPASTHPFNDQHTTPLSQIKVALNPFGQTTGKLVTNQLYQFVDARTGVAGIPIDGSGFIITKLYTVANSAVTGSIQKQGAAVLVVFQADDGSTKSLSTTTGGGKTILAPFTNVPLG